MNKKALAILMRARMRPNHHTNFALTPISNEVNQLLPNSQGNRSGSDGHGNENLNNQRSFEAVRESMHSETLMHKTEVLDSALNDFSEGYFILSFENRRKLLITLAKEYDLNRTQVRELIKLYLGLQPPGDELTVAQSGVVEDECSLSTFYRIERNLRHSLKPVEGNMASLRAMDSNLKDKLSTWLSPAALELHQITWDDPASLLEKIVAYEAVHPISNLIDLKRRLGVGRRCFAYFHSAIPFLWDNPPIAESEAACALFYSISSTQPGLAGINLGKFLIKRVITLVKRDMPHISVFATLSPIPGFMPWLLSKLASQSRLAEAEDISCSSADKSGLPFYENVLEPEEERALINSLGDLAAGKSGMEILLNVLTPTTHEWINSDKLLSALKSPLMRLCARYLLLEKKRGKALDSVANFHLHNGAMVQRINWMADRSEKALSQSAGIMVNYVYRSTTYVRTTVGDTEAFSVEIGLHQRSALSPYIFALIMDDIYCATPDGVPWCMLFADDIVLVAETKTDLNSRLATWKTALEEKGLRINIEKTEYLCSNFSGNQNDEDIENDNKTNVAVWIRMLGNQEGSRNEDGDRRNENALWACGRTLWDLTLYSAIRMSLGVVLVSEKLREERLRWFGHILRRQPSDAVRRVELITVDGARKRGRSRRKWVDCLRSDLKDLALTDDMTSDRKVWRPKTRVVE
ncbi:Malonyl-CoA decarboxylase family protein isoform 2 [Hibiscus syriacus]|uniref:Malonyl-CoA decarboxylase family protein isoform 2 n=1 Tax=Hibiscus syriacus TaxID=106335 RepID=A0A6A3CUC0_HIBSY|nr:Malonyl-CoA decarboxylase family protein isoform 2 [Hibiscus syriacus]